MWTSAKIRILIHTNTVISFIVGYHCPLALAQQTPPAKPGTVSGSGKVNEALFGQIRKRVAEKKVTETDLHDLAKFAKANPGSYKAHSLLGDCYATVGMMDLADSEYLTSIQLDPHRDDVYIAVIEKIFNEKGVLQAEQKLRVMQEKLLGSPVTVLLRVTLMLARGNDWGASHVCEVWERTHTDHFSLPTARALICYQHKDYKTALKEVEKDLKVRPDFRPGLTLKKRVLEQLNGKGTAK